MIRPTLALLAPILLLLLPGPAVAAGRFVELAEVESIGGYTIHNDTTTCWAYVDRGRVRGGYVRVVRRIRSGDDLVLTGRLDARQTHELWLALYRARPWSAREVRNRTLNVDFPDTRVTYLGRIAQRIRSDLGAAGLTPVSSEMLAFLDLVGQRVRTIEESPRFVYEAAGGRFGFRRVLTIRQDGHVVDEVTYTSRAPNLFPYRYEGRLDAGQVAELERRVAAAGWPTLQDFEGHPSWTDGIDEQGTHHRWGRSRTVLGGYPRNRTPAYQAVLDFAQAAGRPPRRIATR